MMEAGRHRVRGMRADPARRRDRQGARLRNGQLTGRRVSEDVEATTGTGEMSMANTKIERLRRQIAKHTGRTPASRDEGYLA